MSEATLAGLLNYHRSVMSSTEQSFGVNEV